jgi:hypothetical protein
MARPSGAGVRAASRSRLLTQLAAASAAVTDGWRAGTGSTGSSGIWGVGACRQRAGVARPLASVTPARQAAPTGPAAFEERGRCAGQGSSLVAADAPPLHRHSARGARGGALPGVPAA